MFYPKKEDPMAIPRAVQAAMQLQRAAYTDEMLKLRQIFLRAEEKIIAEITRKQALEHVTYGEHAALERVQKILHGMMDNSWEYVPKLVEKQYLTAKYTELSYRDAYSDATKTPGIAYGNASALTTSDLNVINRLTQNLMGELTEGAVTALSGIKTAWQESVKIARLESDVFREPVLEGLTAGEATGMGIRHAKDIFLQKIKESGISAFTDKRGRNWSLEAYSTMATRTTSRQATNLGTLLADEEHDLYQMSSHGSTCPICAPLEGRVYSRSGTNPSYPSLAMAFGKIDPNGPDSLENSYLNIHPNCQHVITRFTEASKTEEQVERIREFSSFESNPQSHDPRSEAQINAYRNKEQGRAKLLNDYRQFEKYKMTIGNEMPKTFQTFQKHKMDNSDKYQEWMSAYRMANKAART